jgi:L-ascorbate metabolism protein UlaG (beta-lactamase superfamily)
MSPEGPSDVTARITFIGTATVLIEVGELCLLTDPNFLHAGDHAPLGGGLRSRRLTDPALELEDLPGLDAVVLSHHHGDHFDPIVVRRLDKATRIITTPGSARKLRRQRFTNVTALDTWSSTTVVKGDVSVQVTSTPGKHAPGPLHALLPAVMGSLMDVRTAGRRLRLYVTGDTLLHDRLREIPQRWPDIDLCLIHLGGTRIAGIMLTMDGKQGAEALRIVDPDAAIPIHYDDYTVFRSPLSEFQEAVEEAHLRTRVHYIAPGETHIAELRDLSDEVG